jgi:hypothetical protein
MKHPEKFSRDIATLILMGLAEIALVALLLYSLLGN